MNFLVFIVGGIISLLIFTTYKKYQNKKYKDCPYCAEKIRKEAKLCKHCGSSLVKQKTILEKVIEGNIDTQKEKVKHFKVNKPNSTREKTTIERVIEGEIDVKEGVKESVTFYAIKSISGMKPVAKTLVLGSLGLILSSKNKKKAKNK